MKIFITGANGQLGRELQKRLQGTDFRATDVQELDITDESAVASMIGGYKPDVVIHGAAWTQVDAAEEKPDLAWQVNAIGTQNIAKACRPNDATMVYISTDYVFSGEGNLPFAVDAEKFPVNMYGMTKLFGEQAVQMLLRKYFIIRISWVFGKNGNNFIKTMLRLGKERKELNVVADQWGSPTYTADLAPLICDMIETEKYGVYHATNEGITCWADFAAVIFKETGISCEVHPIPTEAYPTRAQRPKNSRLSKKSLDAAGFHRLPDWRDALKRYLMEIGEK